MFRDFRCPLVGSLSFIGNYITYWTVKYQKKFLFIKCSNPLDSFRNFPCLPSFRTIQWTLDRRTDEKGDLKAKIGRRGFVNLPLLSFRREKCQIINYCHREACRYILLCLRTSFVEQEWFTGETARVLPLCHWFDYRAKRHRWNQVFVGFRPMIFLRV